MQLKDFLEILTFVVSIAAVVVVGRSNIKKQVIADLQALVTSHQLKIEELTKDLAASRDREAKKDQRIEALEDILDGRPELVRAGNHIGFDGQARGNRATAPKTTKNRSSR